MIDGNEGREKSVTVINVMMISSDVCRVPLEDTQNAAAVAAVFDGTYHETTCGFFEKCSALHVQYSNGKGDGASIATWFSCEVDTVRIGVALAALVATAIIVFVLLRRLRGRDEGTEMMPKLQRLKRVSSM